MFSHGCESRVVGPEFGAWPGAACTRPHGRVWWLEKTKPEAAKENGRLAPHKMPQEANKLRQSKAWLLSGPRVFGGDRLTVEIFRYIIIGARRSVFCDIAYLRSFW